MASNEEQGSPSYTDKGKLRFETAHFRESADD